MTRDRPIDGYFFEDFSLGEIFRHPLPRTITEADAALYMSLVGERHSVHCSKPLALAMGYRACPIDDLLVFNIAFGATVADISYNAVANLGYADVRFLAPVYAGDTLSCGSEVIGLKANSDGKSGIVYVRSRAFNQDGMDVLNWIRWVMVAARGPLPPSEPQVPELPAEVVLQNFRFPDFVDPKALDARATGSSKRWESYEPGTVIDHPGGTTVGATEHMIATRLYQNPARVHFDSLAARRSPFKRRLVYGGHVISLCRALSYFGLENAFAIAAIHRGTHANPMFGNDTLYCRHVVLSRDAFPERTDLGILRLRMIGVKNALPASLESLRPGEKHPSVILDLDYSVFIPRGQNT
jgi:2-methylfumaryl-CoA hydratase